MYDFYVEQIYGLFIQSDFFLFILVLLTLDSFSLSPSFRGIYNRKFCIAAWSLRSITLRKRKIKNEGIKQNRKKIQKNFKVNSFMIDFKRFTLYQGQVVNHTLP